MTKLQSYVAIKIIDVQKFGGSLLSEWMELLKIVEKLRLYGIASLDIYNMSSLPPSTTMEENDLCNFFSSILPNLRDVNLSNNGLSSESLYEFSRKCPNLSDAMASQHKSCLIATIEVRLAARQA